MPPASTRDRELLQRWWEQAAQPAPAAPSSEQKLDRAKQALADEDYQVAVDLCLDVLPHAWAYSALLRCAVELENPELTAKVLGLIGSVRLIWTERDRSRIEKLRVAKLAAVPNDARASWVSWARAVAEGMSQTSPTALLDQCVTQWSIEDYLVDATPCETLAQLIGNSQGRSEQIFRDAYPISSNSLSHAQRIQFVDLFRYMAC